MILNNPWDREKNTALPAGTLSIDLKAKQLKLVVPILIELKEWLWEKTFQLRALKNSSKNLTFQKENEQFLRGKYIFSRHSISMRVELFDSNRFYSDGPVMILPIKQYPNPFLKQFLVQTAQFQSAKILDHCAQAQRRIATKNQWHQLCLAASSTKSSILPYTAPNLYSLVYMPICSPICSLICSIRYQFEIPIAPNL